MGVAAGLILTAVAVLVMASARWGTDWGGYLTRGDYER